MTLRIYVAYCVLENFSRSGMFDVIDFSGPSWRHTKVSCLLHKAGSTCLTAAVPEPWAGGDFSASEDQQDEAFCRTFK